MSDRLRVREHQAGRFGPEDGMQWKQQTGTACFSSAKGPDLSFAAVWILLASSKLYSVKERSAIKN